MKNQHYLSKFPGTRYKGLCFVAMLLAIGIAPSSLWAQAPLDPLTPNEKALATKVLLGDAKLQQYMGQSPRYRIVNIERHEEDKARPMAERRADVVIYKYTTDEAISAVVNLGSSPRVDAIVVTRDLPPALSPEEVEEAKRLAVADPGVQGRLSAAGIAEQSFIITHLLARAVQRDAACSTHRCVMLFFNTRDAALEINPVVDLSAQRVALQ